MNILGTIHSTYIPWYSNLYNLQKKNNKSKVYLVIISNAKSKMLNTKYDCYTLGYFGPKRGQNIHIRRQYSESERR